MTTVDVVVTFLELDLAANAGSVTGPAVPMPGNTTVSFELNHVPGADAAGIAAMMYRAVGAPWQWTDRLPWSEADWNQAVNRAGVELWIARVDDEIAGYFELHAESGTVELKYFGLMPEFTGRRIGGALLSAAIDRARTVGAARMTVNTCTLDHPGALPNYLKRGFIVIRTETQRRPLPA